MKKILLFFVAIMAMILVAEAQAPERFSYQSVIRDAAGNLVANEPVGVRVSILQYSPDGSAVYSETHNRATNANGLVTMEIGAGTVVSGTNYTLAGTQQMLSVPYALYAAASGNGEGVSQTDFPALVGRVDSLAQIVANLNGGSGSGDSGDGDNEDDDTTDTTVTAQPCPGAPTVTDVDGNVYNTVQIGEQCWMRENLRTTKYANGTTIPLGGTIASYARAYRYYPNDGNSANVTDYGYLYNWAAVMNGSLSSSANPSGVQGICPTGWHVPSDAEWTELTNYVSSQSQYVCGGDVDYIAKSLASETGWISSTSTNCAVGNNPSANNATGFSARPAGKYTGNYYYYGFGDNAIFWSATQGNSYDAYTRYLAFYYAEVGRDNDTKSGGYSVRCVRNVEGSGSEGGGDNEDTTDTTITAQPCPGAPTVTDVDGNVYNTVQIGEQCWMRENLKTTKYANGTTIPLGIGTAESDEVAYRYYPNNNSANVFDYGYLYNWPAVMNGSPSSNANPSGVQGICPDGWHVPSDAEWDELENYVSSQSQYVCGSSTWNIAKALASETGWISSADNCDVGNNPSTNNATGFSARPAGRLDGAYCNFGISAFFWSATQYFSDNAYYRALDYRNADVSRYYVNKSSGYSVRCVRNVEGSGSEGGSDDEDTTITAQACPGVPTVTDIDGNVYNTVQIGEQCWMRENLKTTKYANGTTIPLGADASSTTAYRYYPIGNNAIVSTYGYLYNWPAVMNGSASSEANPSGVQGICPTGWHVPSDAEWTELTNYVSSQSQYVCGSSTSKIAKALASETGWISSTDNCDVGNNPSTNNATGFSARPAGEYYNESFGSGYYNFGYAAYFWSATQSSGDNAYYRYLYYDAAVVGSYYYTKGGGYSVRCIRNEEGGDDEDTTITAQACPGVPTVTDIDGNVYNTVQIGEQCWMRENLKTTKYANGTTIPLGTETSNDVAYRYYPNDSSANVSTYGYLYNWPAVMNGANSSNSNPSGVQGICPTGWHVPSSGEWTELTDYVSSQSQYVCGSYGEDIAKALASEEGWNSSTYNCTVGNNPDANNATGFSARPAGFYTGNYHDFGNHARFWSAAQYNSNLAYDRYLYVEGANVIRYYGIKSFGCSVRCVRNVEGSGSEGGGDNEGGDDNPDDNDTTITAQACPGVPTVTDIDGNVYNTVQIGEQCWMRENLKTTKYANGTTIPLGTEESDEVAYRYYPNGNNANVSTYGYLYNWPAVMNGSASSEANPSGVQGICPTGWHVPSDAEWTELENYVCSQSQYVCGSSTSYIAKALASEEGWNSSADICDVGNNPDANNATGFSARPAGRNNGDYDGFGRYAYFWTATRDGSGHAYYHYLHYGRAYVAINNYIEGYGYSVRCIRNEEGSGSEGVDDYPDITLSATIYPNPTTDYLTLSLSDNYELTGLECRIFDANGKFLDKKTVTEFRTELDLTRYAIGTYFVNLHRGKQLMKSFKVIKVRE